MLQFWSVWINRIPMMRGCYYLTTIPHTAFEDVYVLDKIKFSFLLLKLIFLENLEIDICGITPNNLT